MTKRVGVRRFRQPELPFGQAQATSPALLELHGSGGSDGGAGLPVTSGFFEKELAPEAAIDGGVRDLVRCCADWDVVDPSSARDAIALVVAAAVAPHASLPALGEPGSDPTELLRDTFPAVAAGAFRLLRRLRRGVGGGQVIASIARVAPTICPEDLGQLYQALRRPIVRAANANAYAGRGKIDGADLLAVTQFLTDRYIAEWLTERTLSLVDTSEPLVVADPAVGGGIFLVLAYRRLMRRERGTDAADWSGELLSEVLRGYDLDPCIAEVAALALWLEAYRTTGRCPGAPVRIGSGGSPVAGALEHGTLSDLLAHDDRTRLAVITNPPFLGRRLMGTKLREHLRVNHPLSGNDLCAAFVDAIVGTTRTGDVIGLVHQSTLAHLPTFRRLRDRLATQVDVVDVVDLGTGAFRDLSGDKARTMLSVLRMRQAGDVAPLWHGVRLDLAAMPRPQKAATLTADRTSTSAPFLVRSDALRGLGSCHPPLREFARPMQGSSTGDNALYVRFAWEVAASEPGWREASKGGGYSRWWGLRRYVVRWGEGGELLGSHPRAALRNPLLSERAHLVWSDTGSGGVNVRRQPPGAVFIASGPGIVVEDADPDAVAAVLNSRVLSAYVRKVNPKYVMAPGILASAPIPVDAVADPELRRLARRCTALKRQYESRRPDTCDWIAPKAEVGDEDALVSTAFDRWRADVCEELERLRIEQEIENRVLDYFGDANLRAEVDETVGPGALRLPDAIPCQRPPDLERRYVESLTDVTRYRGGIRTPLGCDGPLEAFAYALGVSADNAAERLLAAPSGGPATARYVEALLHEHSLAILGYSADRTWSSRSVPASALRDMLRERVGLPGKHVPVLGVDIDRWISQRLPTVHARAFRNRPILRCTERLVVLARRDRG